MTIQSIEGHEPDHEDHRHGHEDHNHAPDVPISINGHPHRIHRGSHTVAELKALDHVPLADDLEQNVNGQLIPLADDALVTIKGGEKFVSHPKDSGAS